MFNHVHSHPILERKHSIMAVTSHFLDATHIDVRSPFNGIRCVDTNQAFVVTDISSEEEPTSRFSERRERR